MLYICHTGDLLQKKSMTPPVRQTVLGEGLHSTSPKLLPRTTQQCPAHCQTSFSWASPSSPSPPSGSGNSCSNLSNSSFGQSSNFMTCCFRTTSIDSCPIACVFCTQGKSSTNSACFCSWWITHDLIVVGENAD